MWPRVWEESAPAVGCAVPSLPLSSSSVVFGTGRVIEVPLEDLVPLGHPAVITGQFHNPPSRSVSFYLSTSSLHFLFLSSFIYYFQHFLFSPYLFYFFLCFFVPRPLHLASSVASFPKTPECFLDLFFHWQGGKLSRK